MTPISKNVTIRFGDHHRIFFRVREREWDELQGKYVPGPYRDLTGYTILSQIRTTADDATTLAQYAPTLGNQADLELGRGAVWLDLTATETGALRDLDPRPKEAVYDVQLTTPASEVYTYVEGKVVFVQDVSRV